jgi:hypothetical protein
MVICTPWPPGSHSISSFGVSSLCLRLMSMFAVTAADIAECSAASAERRASLTESSVALADRSDDFTASLAAIADVSDARASRRP